MGRLVGMLCLVVALAAGNGCRKGGAKAEADVATEVAVAADDEEGGPQKKKKKGSRRGVKGREEGGSKSGSEKSKGGAEERETGAPSEGTESPSIPAAVAPAETLSPVTPAAEAAGAAVTGAVAEVAPAIGETAPSGPSVSPRERSLPEPPARVSAGRYLTIEELNNLLPEKGWISYGPVPGIPPSSEFGSVIYRKPGTNRVVALLVWDFEIYSQALEKWNELLATYPNAQELKGMFNPFLFFSYRNQISSLTFLDSERSMVLSLSCHAQVCDDTALYRLAQAVAGKVR